MLLTIVELTQQSWNNYLKTYRQFLPFLSVILGGLIIRYFIGFLGLYLNAYSKLSDLSVDLSMALIIAALSFLGIWTSFAIIKTTQLILKKQPPTSFKETYINTARYIIPTFFLSLLVALAIFAGSILFLIPGIIFAIWYYFVNYVIVFEDQMSLTSLKTSKQLVVGRWFSMAFRIVLPKLIFLIGIILLDILLENLIIKTFNPSDIKIKLLTPFISGIITTLTLPLFIWSDTILYFNAKENPVSTVLPISK